MKNSYSSNPIIQLSPEGVEEEHNEGTEREDDGL